VRASRASARRSAMTWPRLARKPRTPSLASARASPTYSPGTGSDSGKALSDGLKSAGLEQVAELIRKVSDTAKQAGTSVQSLGHAFADLKSGDVGGGLDHANNALGNIDRSAKNVGIDYHHRDTLGQYAKRDRHTYIAERRTQAQSSSWAAPT
jgi:hypothetical protein